MTQITMGTQRRKPLRFWKLNINGRANILRGFYPDTAILSVEDSADNR